MFAFVEVALSVLTPSSSLMRTLVCRREGYEADGWLGLLLGTSLWYGLFGETLEEAPFERKMDDLVRELGPRGRSQQVTAAGKKLRSLTK